MQRVTIHATVPSLRPPAWALAQRSLFDLLDSGWRTFAAKLTRPDGSLRYSGALSSRDGADDFFEPFFNWPQLYLLGGADDLLEHSTKHWHGLVGQMTALGMYRDEFEIGYDWFHQGESLLFTYFLTMAAPAQWRERAERFADLYLDPAAGNYDPDKRIIKAPHNGSGGAREGVSNTPYYPWLAAEATQYGFPLDWLETHGEPLSTDPRLGPEMQRRLGRGDVAGNLSVAGLVLNAYLAGGEPRFRDWLRDYVGAWQERAKANDGIVPDNVGVDGVVGSQLDGRWYGGHYGWTWPHGLYSIGQATTVGALAAAVATGDESYVDLSRGLIDRILAEGVRMRFADSDSSLRNRWNAHLGPAVCAETLLVPYRHSDRGWFDYNPVQTSVPMALWHHTAAPEDAARLDRLRAASGYDWSTVRPFRDKEEAGHEEPWYAYLRGDNPGYPEQILAVAHTQARRRLVLLLEGADRDLPEEHIHFWQNVNPVVTEALAQLTWGGPQVIYNGGLPQARVRYFDAERHRPGLPPGVAALVSAIDPEATVVTLVNLSADTPRTVTVQAGSFAEHDILVAAYTTTSTRWAGHDTEYLPVEPVVTDATAEVGGPWFDVALPPGSEVRLTLRLAMRVRPPSYRQPWEEV
jgi:hypothetical protein